MPLLWVRCGKHPDTGVLLMSHLHHLLDVSRGDEVHGHLEGLAADVHVGARQRAEDVHEHLLEDLGVVLLEPGEALEHDQLHVVVALGVEQLGVRRRRLLGPTRGRHPRTVVQVL